MTMTDSRQIAEEVIAYSKEHENDALEAGESYGDMKWVGWEVPYYCYSVEEMQEMIIEEGYTTTKQAIAGFTKSFQNRHAVAEDIRGEGDPELRPGSDDWDEFIAFETQFMQEHH
jgi:hypothetical protein